MSQQELLIKVVHALESADIDYMLTGSMVSSLQGTPRMTHDVDFVVALPVRAIKFLVDKFPHPEYYLDEMSVRDAVNTKFMFNQKNSSQLAAGLSCEV